GFHQRDRRLNSIVHPQFAQGLGIVSPLTRFEYERERDESDVRIRRTRSRPEQVSRSGRRVVRSSRARKSGASVSFLHVTDGIFYSGFPKAFETQQTRIAFATGDTFRRGIVTTMGEGKIDTEFGRFTNNLGF